MGRKLKADLFFNLDFFFIAIVDRKNELWMLHYTFLYKQAVLTHSVQVFPHIETSQLICCANQLTGFYMRATLALNGFKQLAFGWQIEKQLSALKPLSLSSNKNYRLKEIKFFHFNKRKIAAKPTIYHYSAVSKAILGQC